MHSIYQPPIESLQRESLKAQGRAICFLPTSSCMCLELIEGFFFKYSDVADELYYIPGPLAAHTILIKVFSPAD